MRRLLLAAPLLAASFMFAAQTPARADSAGPAIAVAATSLTFGETLTVTGTGFAPNDWAMVIMRQPSHTQRVHFVMTSAAGEFTYKEVVTEAQGAGTKSIAAYAYTTQTMTKWTHITLSAPEVLPGIVTATGTAAGTGLQLVGKGLLTNSLVLVDVEWANKTTDSSGVWINADGLVNMQIPVTSGHGCTAGTVKVFSGDGMHTLLALTHVTLSDC